jgi:hypothetical protein
MSQKAIRNQSGKPVTPESLDKKDEARHKPSANPVIVVQDGKHKNLIDKVDRDYAANRLAQARAEQPQPAADPQKVTEFDVMERRGG